MSGAQLSSGLPLDRRFTGPHAIMNPVLLLSIGDIYNPVEAGAWYPDAFKFNEFSGGLGDGDIPPSTALDEPTSATTQTETGYYPCFSMVPHPHSSVHPFYTLDRLR